MEKEQTYYITLKDWRVSAGLTQEQLAEKIGSTSVSISRYESRTRKTIRAEIVEKIFVISGGQVTANALYNQTPERAAKLAKKNKVK